MLRTEAKLLWTLLRGQPRSGSLKRRLEGFYAPQASRYDNFRERLLHGRAEMLAALELAPGQRVLELGGGTARNLEFYANLIPKLASVQVVDLCGPLLTQARHRCARWTNVYVTEADATVFRPPKQVDRLYFSYALTMMPKWREAIDNAWQMLKPGGMLGVVDFYVSGPPPTPGERVHHWLTRQFWPRWFAHDGVYLEPERLRYLMQRFEVLILQEDSGSIPYLPGLCVPYFQLIARKPDMPLSRQSVYGITQ